MKHMFASATVKMTTWYLLILMAISLLFSGIIYNISTHELDDRLNLFQTRIEPRLKPRQGADMLGELREGQAAEAKARLFIALVYTNLIILGLGGVASYFLARWTLKPIEESHDAEARFTSNASHELRTPLAVMKSELEVALRDKNLAKNDMREILESNLEEVNRLSALSNTLLKLSRGELRPSDFEKTNFSSIIRKSVAQFSSTQRTFNVSVAKNLAIERGNESSLSELCMIVLENACNYSPEGSTIKVLAAERGGKVELEVENTGLGIMPDDLPHVFERFYRGDKSHSSRSARQGYGLGLSLAQQIVALHNGTITMRSTPNVTTTVTILLPKS